MQFEKWLEKAGVTPVAAEDGSYSWCGEVEINAASLGMTAEDADDWRDLWSMIGKEPPVAFPEGAKAILHTAANSGRHRQRFDFLKIEDDGDWLNLHIYPAIFEGEPKKGDPYIVMLFPADIDVAQFYEPPRKWEPPPPEPEPSFDGNDTLKCLRQRASRGPRLG